MTIYYVKLTISVIVYVPTQRHNEVCIGSHSEGVGVSVDIRCTSAIHRNCCRGRASGSVLF